MNSKKKILIVEDEVALSKVLSLKLSNKGYDVSVVCEGNSFLSSFEKEKPDIVLLDIMIPGLDGFSILKDLKDKKYNTPIIVLSNLNQEEDKKKARDLGARDYFVKSDMPISEIIEKIKLILK